MLKETPITKIDKISHLKIAYFAGTMKPGHDGVTRVLYRTIDELNKRRIKNIFFSPIIPAESERTTTMVEVPSITFPLYRDYKLPLTIQKHIEKTLNYFMPDIIHINSPCPLGYAAVKYGLRHKVPVVATYHTHFASYAKYYNIKALEFFGWNYLKNLYNKCDAVFVPSVPILNELSLHGFNTIKLLPHGIDTQLFNPGFHDSSWKLQIGAEGKTVLLFAGRLVWEKDLKTLVNTYKIISARRDDLVFVLAGDGPIKQELKQLMPGAKFLGQLSSYKLSTAYSSSDIFVFPSTTETFGNVTAEAMACGLPPICADEGGAAGLIENGGNGLLVKPRDAQDLAAKIEFLADNYEYRKRLALNALTFARTQSWENIFEKLFKGYLEIANSNLIKSGKARHFLRMNSSAYS